MSSTLFSCLSGNICKDGDVFLAKSEVTGVIEPRCQRLADSQGLELVEVSLDRENTGKYLRVYIDKPEGVTLDDCERYHRALVPLVEDFDYDFLEVSSPGVDRPLKKDRDFERALGSEVEVRLFKAIDGQKAFTGVLADYSAEDVTLDIGGENRVIPRRAAAVIRPVVDMSGVEDVEFPDA